MMTEEDWPSQSFRDHVIHRLEPELARNRQNAPNLPVPGDAKQVEEYVFQKCVSKDEYMRTIAKVINAINCNSKSAAVPSVLHPSHFTNNNANKPSPGSGNQIAPGPGQIGGALGTASFKPQVPPDPQPTQHRNAVEGQNNSRFQTPPLGQPPPMISAAQGMQTNVSTASGMMQNQPHAIGGPSNNGHMGHPYNYNNPQFMSTANQYNVPQESSFGAHHKGYGMQPAKVEFGSNPIQQTHGPGAQQHPMMNTNVDQQLMQQQQRMWTPNGPTDQLTGRPMYQQLGGQMHNIQQPGYSAHGAPMSSQPSVLENLIGGPAYGQSGDAEQLPANIAMNLKQFGEDEKLYLKMINSLRPHLDLLQSRMATCGNQPLQTRLAFAIDVIQLQKPAKVENLRGIEMFVQKELLGGGNVQQQYGSVHAPPPQQQQPIVDAVNAVLLNETQPPVQHMSGYCQPSVGANSQSSWSQSPWGPPAETKSAPGGPMQLGSPPTVMQSHQPNVHGGYPPNFSQGGSYSNNFSNRAAPYPMPPHHLKYTSTGLMQHHQQQQQHPQQIQSNVQPSYHQTSNYMPQQVHQQSMSQTPMLNTVSSMPSYTDDMQHSQPMDMSSMNTDYSHSVPGPVNNLEQMQTSANSLMRLPAEARSELAQFESRITFQNNLELSPDGSYIVVCALRRQQVPHLRLVIPRTYPQQPASVERAALDLDSFYYDDLQNAIHDQLNKAPAHNVTDILNIWENMVSQYYNNQDAMGGFDDLLSTTNFGEM